MKFITLNIEGFAKNSELIADEIRYFSVMNQPFRIEVDCTFNGKDRIQPDSIIGRKVSIKIQDSNELRYLNGILYNVKQSNSFSSNNSPSVKELELFIGPELTLLGDVENSRVFPKGNVIDYIKDVTKDYNIDIKEPGRPDFAEREFCIQYRERDLDFIDRLMESEGIFYYFKQNEKGHQLVLGSTVTDYSADEPVQFGDKQDQVYYTSFSKEDSLLIGYNSLNDYDYNAPRKTLKSEHIKSKSSVIYQNSSVSSYSYPYPVRSYTDSENNTIDTGEKYSSIQLDSKQTNNEKIHLHAKGMWWGLDTGSRFTVQGENSEFIVTSYTLTINDQNGSHDENSVILKISAINANDVYRPLMSTPVPDIPVQTATVVGMSDGTVYNKTDNGDDKKIMVKVKFYWDIEHSNTSNECSCWMRSCQAWAGNQRGFVFTPRVGDEVVVAFESGHPDMPIIIGGVHNGKNKLPYSVAEKKNISAIVSRTVPDGQESSSVMFKDDKGLEEMDFYTVGRQNTLVKKDMNMKINGVMNIEATEINLHAVDKNGNSSFINITPELITILSKMINENSGGAPVPVDLGELEGK